MGALEKARNRSIDSLWEVNAKTIMALEATLGVAIGSDDGRVIYIQDTGVKEVGRGYIDRATKKVHICKERTEDVINTSAKFEDISVDTINNKLQNLYTLKFETIDYDNYRIHLRRIGYLVSIILVEIEAKDRSYLEVIVPTGIIPEIYHPISGVVLELIQAPNSGPFRIKVSRDGSLIALYRYGSTNVIYNNQIENSAFTFIAKII